MTLMILMDVANRVMCFCCSCEVSGISGNFLSLLWASGVFEDSLGFSGVFATFFVLYGSDHVIS